MNFNQYTIKSQEAINKAVEIAQANQHQAIEPAHILKGMFSVDEKSFRDFVLLANSPSIACAFSIIVRSVNALYCLLTNNTEITPKNNKERATRVTEAT